MKYWIGVVGSALTKERFFTEDDTWFCMPKSCESGDFVAMYASKKVAGVRSGMFGIYQVQNKDACKDVNCRTYGIFSGNGERPVYVFFKLVKKFEKSISFDEMKKNRVLSNTPYVRRNMQATYFSITEREYHTIEALGDSQAAVKPKSKAKPIS